jgi:hypothetical protein
MVQFASAARLKPQLFVCAKSPTAAMLVIAIGALVLFPIITACDALVTLTG